MRKTHLSRDQATSGRSLCRYSARNVRTVDRATFDRTPKEQQCVDCQRWRQLLETASYRPEFDLRN